MITKNEYDHLVDYLQSKSWYLPEYVYFTAGINSKGTTKITFYLKEFCISNGIHTIDTKLIETYNKSLIEIFAHILNNPISNINVIEIVLELEHCYQKNQYLKKSYLEANFPSFDKDSTILFDNWILTHIDRIS